MVNNYSLSYSALYLKNVFDTGENRRIFLNRISSNETVQKKNLLFYVSLKESMFQPSWSVLIDA